ncbi:GNAT family N-acetyltransferase [Erysipelotrichaceae bacterium OttesenSCG-928-M19]|nr:GNAT family N-acetyltransferase [Erysipelotrichaceae bacterium OttesenSCG-928-M19]
MKYLIETKRLFLREISWADYDAIAEIIQNDETMYAYNGGLSDEETKEWLEKLFVRYKRDKHGLLAVVLKENGKVIGQAGLSTRYLDDKKIIELGYLFNKDYWKQGYAIEAVQALKEYGFNYFGFDEIYSLIRDTNIPSMNVAIRNGMVIRKRYLKQRPYGVVNYYAFSVKRTE